MGLHAGMVLAEALDRHSRPLREVDVDEKTYGTAPFAVKLPSNPAAGILVYDRFLSWATSDVVSCLRHMSPVQVVGERCAARGKAAGRWGDRRASRRGRACGRR